MPFSVSKFSRLFRVSTHAKSLSFALLFIRGVAGGAFILHGLNKVTHPFDWMGPTAEVPGFLQLLAAVAEFGGGIAWVVGLFFPLACIGIIATMIGAVLTQAFILRDPFVNLGSRNSYELACGLSRGCRAPRGDGSRNFFGG